MLGFVVIFLELVNVDSEMLNEKVSKSEALRSYSPAKFFFVNENKAYLQRLEQIEEENKRAK